MALKRGTAPIEKKDELIIGTIQYTLGLLVHPNQNMQIGIHQLLAIAGGSRFSGGILLSISNSGS
jgi:hypothetical protein